MAGGSVAVGSARGHTGGVLFVKGEEPRRVEGDLAEALIREVRERLEKNQ